MFLLVGLGAAYVYDKLVKGNIALKIGFMLAIAGMVSYYAVGTIVRNRDWKDEISFFTSTLKYHPQNARLYLNLGNTYYEKGDVAKAIEQYQKSIDINKDYAVAYGNIGSAFLHEGKAKEAEEYLTKAVGLQQNYPIAHYNLGIISFQKGDYEGAVKELKLSTEQLPQFFQAWNMLGRTYLKLGNGGEAKGAFERSLSIMPSQPDIQMILQKIGETRP
jgi:tetratricopeptide (TPR) repeat protein